MRRANALVGGAALALTLVLGACGGNDDVGGDGAIVTGAVIKGPVSGAQVCAFALSGGSKGAPLPLSLASGATGTLNGACYVTPADGSYQFRLPPNTTGDVLIEATGGTFCPDESPIAAGACPAGATPLTLGSSGMASVLSVPGSGTATVYTTPLTTAATRAAPQGGLTAAAFNSQFNTLAGQVIGANSGVTPATQPTVAQQRYLLQVSQFVQGGGSLASAVTALSQGTTTFQVTPATGGGNPGGASSPATVNAALAGSHTLVFNSEGGGCGSRCSYTNGQTLTFTVHADGRLVLPSGTQLSNPFNRVFGTAPNPAEIIWLDVAANIEYALSNNSTGSFSEINVGDAAAANAFGIPGFLGQLRKPVTSGGAAVLIGQFAGTYSTAYQYKGANVAWTGVTIDASGAITFNGGSGPSITPANVVQVRDFVTCCGRVSIETNLDLNGSASGAPNQIHLYKDASGALRSIEYDTGDLNVIEDDTGVRVTSTTLAALTHDGTPTPATNVVNGTLGNQAMNFPVVFASLSSQGGFVEASSGTGAAPVWLIQFASSTPLVEGETYHCRNNSSSPPIRINARRTANGALISTDYGGRCSITVTRLVTSGTTVIEMAGTFSAEIGDDKQTPVLVTNGVFRYAP